MKEGRGQGARGQGVRGKGEGERGEGVEIIMVKKWREILKFEKKGGKFENQVPSHA